MRKSFIFYASWWEAIEDFPRDVQGDVLTAIVEYGLYGETTKQLKKIASTILNLVKPQIDANNECHEGVNLCGKPVEGRNSLNGKREKSTEKRNNEYVQCNMFDEDDIINKPFTDDEREMISYKSICDYYNKTCIRLPKCMVMSERRKGAIRLRAKETSIQDVYKVIDKVAKSSFLCGNNDKNWVANFDWIFNPTNFLKILEGNYDGEHEEDRRADMQRQILDELNEEAKRRREELGCV